MIRRGLGCQLRRVVAPKHGADPKLVRFLDQTANIVADDLAENFIDHRHVRFAAHVIAELRLDHRERGLDVAALERAKRDSRHRR